MKRNHPRIRKALCLMLALVMVLGMFPALQANAADGTTLYLVPNANWKNDNARFAIYSWDTAGNTWSGMSDADGDGVYEGTVPAGHDNVIFCRMSPTATANNWTNKWNQTADLTVPTDGSNCYTVKEGTWDSGGGTWSTYSPAGEEPTPDPEPEPEPEPAPAGTYYVAGVAALCGSEWNEKDPANQMIWNAGSGLFEMIYQNVPVGTYQFKITDGTWINTWGKDGQNYTFEVTAVCDVTITFNPNSKSVRAEGDHVAAVTSLEIASITAVGAGKGNFLNGKSWDAAAAVNHMTASGSIYTITYQNVAAGTYEVKFAANDSWNDNWGSNGSAYTSGSAEAVYNGQNIKFTVREASDITLKLDLTGFKYATKTGAKFAIDMVPVSTEPEPTDPEPSEPDEPVTGYAVKLNFMKPDSWSSVNVYLWQTSGAVPGYEGYNTWPGKAISDSDADGWYDLTVYTEGAFSFIFNNGSSQTADLSSGAVTGDMELWIVGNEVSAEKPMNTTLIHFRVPDNWDMLTYAYAWDASGALLLGEWPGPQTTPAAGNALWCDITVKTDAASFNFIFSDYFGNQTADLNTGTLGFTNELWVYGDGIISRQAPADWLAIPEVFVPGSFPGPSWDPGSNEMIYNGEFQHYYKIFENVPAGNYQYKIAVGGSWDENYGMGGVRDGANYSVTVPKQMDVTVFYSPVTHLAVTNLDYEFVMAAVTGTGFEAAPLTDYGLTGIYSGTVYMPAGTYTDVQILCGDDVYSFAQIVLTEGKDVTFYLDPVTGIYYCNASDIPLNTSAIRFDSQDKSYKSVFGAIEENQEVTFTIHTGDDVISAVLVVKGVDSFPMEKAESGWSAAVSIPNKGEYDYYFVLSNGSNVAVYGDDDGYYGSGQVTDLTSVMPYDLVVYEAGYETPDWMKNAVIYQIFPDRFFNGDESNDRAQEWARGEVDYEFIENWYTLPENPEQEGLLDEAVYKSSGAWYGDGQWSNEIYGGDLKGITERIDYLKALGINVIYLNPVFWSISNHRYDAVSYTEIDPILGTLGDFEELVAVAEANDMHIILDGVFNHVSDDSVYFDRYYKFLGKSEKIGAYPYWAYVYDAMAEQGMTQPEAEAAAVAFFGENYGITDYSYIEWFHVSSTPMTYADSIGLRAGKPVYSYEGWWGYDSMPVIYSTEGSEYRTGNWAEEIIEGESSVNAYWLSKGMDGWRLDVANEVSDETWQHFRDSVKALDSDAVIIGEIWDDATKYLMGDMYDSVMNYQFRNAVVNFAKGGSAAQATRELEKIRERYPEEAFYAMMNLVGSHDTTRILSYLNGIGDDRNQKDFDSAFPTYENTSSLAKSRQYVVAFLQFTYPGAPTVYYGDEIGMVGSDDPDDRRAFEWGKGNRELVEYYARLAAIRNAYPALRTGDLEPVDLGSDRLLAYKRSDSETTLLVIAENDMSGTHTITLDYDAVDLITDTYYPAGEEIPTSRLGLILVPHADFKQVTVNTKGLRPAWHESYIVGANPFTDVPENSWYYESVLWALGEGITSGATETTFNPGGELARAQVVTMLWRAAGSPKVNTQNPFTDVSESDWFYHAVLWAYETGVTSGISPTKFDPKGVTNRTQAVTFLWSYLGKPGSTGGNSFTDVPAGAWYEAPINWAVENHITSGIAPDAFGVSLPCNRAQMVTFLYSALVQTPELAD